MLNLSIFAMALCQIVIYLEYIENKRLHVCDFGTRVLLYIYLVLWYKEDSRSFWYIYEIESYLF